MNNITTYYQKAIICGVLSGISLAHTLCAQPAPKMLITQQPSFVNTSHIHATTLTKIAVAGPSNAAPSPINMQQHHIQKA